MEIFRSLSLDHVKFIVGDVEDTAARWCGAYGFRQSPLGAGSVMLGTDDIRIVLAEPQDEAGRAFHHTHGDGPADIAIATPDVRAAFAQAVRKGATPLAEPSERDGVTTATIGGFGDVVHTFVQRAEPGGASRGLLNTIDHIAVCVEADSLDPVVAFYETALGFQDIFQERIRVGTQAMDSRVVQSQSGSITLTIIAPDLTHDPGQIDEFLKNNGGAGVQHLALSTSDIVTAVGTLAGRGVRFLHSPDAYYDAIAERLHPDGHSVADLHQHRILVDEDHGGQLFQIFTRSDYARRTFFFEVIERRGATTFGSGNIKALYEAIELERTTGEE